MITIDFDKVCLWIGYAAVVLATIAALAFGIGVVFDYAWNKLKPLPGFMTLFFIYFRQGRRAAKAQAAEVIAKANKGAK